MKGLLRYTLLENDCLDRTGSIPHQQKPEFAFIGFVVKPSFNGDFGIYMVSNFGDVSMCHWSSFFASESSLIHTVGVIVAGLGSRNRCRE
jgi:hypothetical protein